MRKKRPTDEAKSQLKIHLFDKSIMNRKLNNLNIKKTKLKYSSKLRYSGKVD
jgi:hypothetical protein